MFGRQPATDIAQALCRKPPSDELWIVRSTEEDGWIDTWFWTVKNDGAAVESDTHGREGEQRPGRPTVRIPDRPDNEISAASVSHSQRGVRVLANEIRGVRAVPKTPSTCLSMMA